MEKNGLYLAGEEKNQKKARTIAIILHLLLLLIMFFFFFPSVTTKMDPDIPPKIVVDFSYKASSLSKYAHADTGKPKPKTKNVEKVKAVKTKVVKPVVKKPTIKKPEVKKPEIKPATTPVTQDDSPVVMEEDDVVIEDPDIELEDVPEPEPLEEVEEVAEEVPSTDASDPSDTDGSSDVDPSMTEGEDGGTGKGKTGDGPGDGKGNDSTSGKGDAGNGTGTDPGRGDGIFGRRVVKRNIAGIYKTLKESGIIAAKVCINKSGVVSYVELLEMESTIKDRKTLRKALEAFQGYLYEPDFGAPEEQCGKLTLQLDINAFK